MLMQLRLQEAPHPAPRTTKNEIRSHTHRGRARRRVQPRTHQLAASRRVCVARFRQPVAADSIVDPPAGLLMQLRSQPVPRPTKNEIRSRTHRGRARQRVQPRTHQLAASHRVCAARFRQSGAPASIFDPPAGHANAVAAAGGAPPSPSHYKKRNTFPPTSRLRAPAGAATHTSTRRVPPSVRSAISTARGRAIAINIAIRVQYVTRKQLRSTGSHTITRFRPPLQRPGSARRRPVAYHTLARRPRLRAPCPPEPCAPGKLYFNPRTLFLAEKRVF